MQKLIVVPVVLVLLKRTKGRKNGDGMACRRLRVMIGMMPLYT